MIPIKLYYAEVIDNDDQNHDDGKKLGRIKVKVLPEMKDIKDSYLPWIRPFIQKGMSSSQYSYHSPEVGDKIWVIFLDDYWKEGYYLWGAFIDGFFDYASIESDLGNIAESIDTTYPNVKFYYTPDGSLFFLNTDTGDKGFLNSNGLYVIIDTDGKSYFYFKDQEHKFYNDNTEVYIQDDGKVTVTTNNDIQINTDNIVFDLKNDGTYKIEGNGTIECTSTGQLQINGTNLTVDT
jgi:hypothetical protein